jgi:hypothetical protein
MIGKFRKLYDSPAGFLIVISVLFLIAWIFTPEKQMLYLIIGLTLGFACIVFVWVINKAYGKVAARKISYIFLALWFLAIITGIIDGNYYGIAFGIPFLPALLLILLQIRIRKIFTWSELLPDRKQ